MTTKLSRRLPASIASRLTIPVIAAPMLRVSGPDLVVATCRAGVIGAFPTLNPALQQPPESLDVWLETIQRALSDHPDAAPMCPNIVMRNADLAEHVASVVRHRTEIVITSVGSPKPIMPQLKDAGILVLADVATLEHAQKAIHAGVDGLVLLTAGAGGQTGWLNAFAYVRAVRKMFDGIIVLAGGITDGVSLRAAEVLGCDLAYMGTKFIPTIESMASPHYREALVSDSMDNIVLTKAFNGLWGSFMRSSIERVGLDPDNLDESISEARAREEHGSRSGGAQRWTNLTSAGHSISGVDRIENVASLVERIIEEYREAASG